MISYRAQPTAYASPFRKSSLPTYEEVVAENDTLRERITQLEEAMASTAIHVPVEYGLTATEETIFRALMTRAEIHTEGLMTLLYSGRNTGRLLPDPKIVAVLICKIRRKVEPFGVKIDTIWGRGYALRREAVAA